MKKNEIVTSNKLKYTYVITYYCGLAKVFKYFYQTFRTILYTLNLYNYFKKNGMFVFCILEIVHNNILNLNRGILRVGLTVIMSFYFVYVVEY